MDFDVLSWVLLALLAAFGLGWLASRIDFVQLKLENKRSPKAYFLGLNLLLNEQHDAAVDAFVEAVQNDPDTSELHFALGNLFRRRGEYNRAVRVHKHLLARADLNRLERDRAQYALAQDYLKAGLLNFAEETLLQLDGSSYQSSARLALLGIYERSRDWPRALGMAVKLEGQNIGSFDAQRAHFLCEMAASDVSAQHWDQALEKLDQAIQISPEHARAKIQKAQLLKKLERLKEAFALLQQVAQRQALAFSLAANTLVSLAQALTSEEKALLILQANYQETFSIDVLKAIVSLHPDQSQAYYAEHLSHKPSMLAVAAWLQGEQIHNDVQKAVDKVSEPLARYLCAACGFSPNTYFWQCPGCLNWDSIPARRVEEL